MTNPTSHFQASCPSAPVSLQQTTSSHVSAPESSSTHETSGEKLTARDRYIAYARKIGLIDKEGPLQKQRQEIWMLDASDQEHIQALWHQEQTLTLKSEPSLWRFHTLFSYILSYFPKIFKGSTIELTQGTFYVVGHQYWKKQLEKRLDSTSIDQYLSPEMWNFCTQPPSCYEFWIRLPASSQLDTTTLHQFKNLILYFLAVQSQHEDPIAYGDAIKEFGSLLHRPPVLHEYQVKRLSYIKDKMEEIPRQFESGVREQKGQPYPFATLEIPCSPNCSLKFVFTSLPPDPSSFHLRLNLDENTVLSSLICPSSDPWEALHDQLLHRLTLPSPLTEASQIQRALGEYWLYLTCHGIVFNHTALEKQLLQHLKSSNEKSSSWILQAVAAGRKALPSSVGHLLAYHFNAHYFLHQQGIALENHFLLQDVVEGDPGSLNRLGLFLRRHFIVESQRADRIGAVLSWVGALQSRFSHFDGTPAQALYSKESSQLEVREGTADPSSPYLVVSADIEKALMVLKDWIQEDKPHALACISEALELFFPLSSLKQGFLMKKRSASSQASAMEEIYQTLKDDHRLSQTRLLLFLVLLRAEGRSIQENDLLDLPVWLADAAATGELPLTLDLLAAAYQGSRLFSLFEAIREQITALKDPSPASCGLACLKALLQCHEPIILEKAWTSLYPKIEEPLCLDVLKEIGPCLDEKALSFALTKVCQLCHPKQHSLRAEQQIVLLALYLNRLIAFSNHHQFTLTYQPKLIELLRPLLEAHQQQYVHLLDYPQLLHTMCFSATSFLQNLQDQFQDRHTNLDVWWGHLLQVHRSLQALEKYDKPAFDRLVDLCQIALQSPKAHLSSKKGFASFVESLAQKLVDEKEFLRLMDLLQHIPIVHSDQMVHRWFQVGIEPLMQQVALGTITPILASFRVKGLYPHLDQAFLLYLVSTYMKRVQQEKKAPFEKTFLEIRSLQAMVSPENKKTSHYLDLVLSYYSKLLEFGATQTLIEEMASTLSVFQVEQKARLCSLIEEVASIVLQQPENGPLWNQFADLLELLKKDDFFLESSLKILEKLANTESLHKKSIKSPPFQCFMKKFPQIEKRLSTQQQQRLALAYAAVMGHAMNEKKEAELIKALPSLTWLLNTLKINEKRQVFTSLFLRFFSRPKADFSDPILIPSMLWIATDLPSQTDSSLFENFCKILLSIPLKDLEREGAEWKASIATLMTKNPFTPFVNRLFSLLNKLGTQEEKEFFTSCAQIPEQRRTELLAEYANTRTIPTLKKEKSDKTTEEKVPLKIERLLSKPSTKSLQAALQLLETLPPEEDEIWEKFLKHLPDHATPGLLKQAWEIWLKHHPIQQIDVKKGKYWSAMVQALLSAKCDITQILQQLADSPLFVLLGQLETVECRQIVTISFQATIRVYWEKPYQQCQDIIQKIVFLTYDPCISQKTGPYLLLLSPEMQIRFSLLLAYLEDPIGLEEIFQRVTTILDKKSFNDKLSRFLFKSYCKKPFVPFYDADQAILYSWIDQSWSLLYSELEWNSACKLLETLCQFNSKKKDQKKIEL